MKIELEVKKERLIIRASHGPHKRLTLARLEKLDAGDESISNMLVRLRKKMQRHMKITDGVWGRAIVGMFTRLFKDTRKLLERRE